MLLRRNGLAARTLGLVPLWASPFLLLPARDGQDTTTYLNLKGRDMNYRTITIKVPTFTLPKLALPSLPFTVKIERKAQPAPEIKRTRKTKQAHA